jgi:hypothetical protein
MQPITRSDYASISTSLRAINPKYQRQVVAWAKASRLVDYWVDEGHVADDLDFKASLKTALRNEEKFCNEMLVIERDLPKRELVNARRQLQQAIENQYGF